MKHIDLTRQLDFLTKLFSDYRPEEPGAVIDLEPACSPAHEATVAPEAPAAEPAETSAPAETAISPQIASSSEPAVNQLSAEAPYLEVNQASAAIEVLADTPACAPSGEVDRTDACSEEDESLLEADDDEVELLPLERFLRELAEQNSVAYPHTACWTESVSGQLALCATKRTALTILVRRDSTVDNVEWGVISMLAEREGARAVRETRTYDLWRGRYYDIVVAKLLFDDRTETRPYYFDISKSMFR